MIPTLRYRNRELLLNHGELTETPVAETYLTSEGTSGVGTLTVANIVGFAINQILVIEEFGSERTEIIKTHTSTAPTGTTITLASNLTKTHPAGSRVIVIPYDQFELSHATTATGTKTVLTLNSGIVSIDPCVLTQAYNETEFTTGYYFARYKNSISSTYGSYTDALVYTGWGANTVGYLVERAMKRLSTDYSDLLTKSYCYEEVNDGIRYIKGKQLRWPDHAVDNYVAGQTAMGTNTLTLPTDIYDTTSNKSIRAVRIGKHPHLTYRDPQSFAEQYLTVAQTQVRTQATSGQTTLEIDNSYDFADSGSVSVYISGTKYTITYTGVTRSATAGVLTGVPASGTGSISVTIPVDTNVWQNETVGVPIWYTVQNGTLEYYPLPDSSSDNQNIFLDYDTVATAIDSDGDTLDIQRFDMLLDYLTWKIKMLVRNDGNLDMNDGYFISFKERLNDAIRNLGRGRRYKMKPVVNRVQYSNRSSYISSNDRNGTN